MLWYPGMEDYVIENRARLRGLLYGNTQAWVYFDKHPTTTHKVILWAEAGGTTCKSEGCYSLGQWRLM